MPSAKGRQKWPWVVSGLTFESWAENGNPLSRAKDQICRDAVAISLMTADTRVMMTIADMMDVPALLFVTS